MITTAAREGKKKISPYMPQEGAAGMAYHGLCVFLVTLTVNYLVIPFQLLGLTESLDVWGTFSFGIHALVVGLYLVCQMIPTKKAQSKSKTA
ncbi:acyltransferase [Ectocarpus siliculosus]|uniref:Acyltransferase n=1 Tax=Ectocarpus siliculosus TaxID=2880 RepID=D7FYY0_ECTSI|nr:acyltransferase [Ectocarpus siliculosus]|eukprot:CBJ26622.1 acyltransferase [Ectocarpus siliculosus]